MATTNEPRLVSGEDKRLLATRLARIEGQLRGIQQMIDREESCELVAQQLAAARSALGKAFFDLIARTFEKNCLRDMKDDPGAREKLTKMMKILTKYA